MTTPQFPYGSTDPSDLPQGVLAPSQFQTALQDQTTDKFQNLASSRFPGTAKTTSAGSPANVGGPMGFIVRLFSQIVSTAANADPATITKPEDLVDLTGGFFHGLPLLQTAIIEPLSHLLSWITGRPSEDFDTVDELKGAFFDWLDDIPFIGPLVQALQGLAVSGPLAFISGLMNIRWAQADATEVTATEAIAAATEANNTVLALINGGRRTIFTSDFTYVKPPNLVKLGVIIMAGGGSGTNGATGNQPGGIGGSYLYGEFPDSAVPPSVPGTVGAGKTGGSGDRSPGTTSFGSLLTNLVNGGGAIASSTGFINASDSAPGAGGASGIGDAGGAPAYGTVGGSSALAAGGAPGTSNGAPGQAGKNAPTTGQTLAGGGGGGGGYSAAVTFAAGGAGGAGGFPGGAGGAGGRGAGTNKANGGPGAPGMIALIEFLS